MYKVPLKMVKGVLLHSDVEYNNSRNGRGEKETVLRLLIKARFDTDIPSCRHSAGRM